MRGSEPKCLGSRDGRSRAGLPLVHSANGGACQRGLNDSQRVLRGTGEDAEQHTHSRRREAIQMTNATTPTAKKTQAQLGIVYLDLEDSTNPGPVTDTRSSAT